MPTFDSARITPGDGTVTFANTVAATIANETVLPSLANAAASSTISFAGQNLGDGIGLYVGLTTAYQNVQLLNFKSLYGGIGINLTDLGSSILVTATGEIAPQYFIDLADGPGTIIADALLISNGTTRLGWLPPPDPDHQVLVWTGTAIAWAAPTSVFSFTGHGDDAITVATQSLANGLSFSLSLANTTVTPGTYVLPTITVDPQGRVTAIANIAGLTPVTSFSVVTDGNILATPNTVLDDSTISLALANTTVVPGTYSFATFAVDRHGRIEAIYSGTSVLTGLNIAGDADITVIGNAANGLVTMGLAPTTVAPGSYTLASLSVDENGRLLRAANGVAVTAVSLIASDTNIIVLGNPISSSGTFAIGLTTTSVSAGTYGYASIEVDAYGRVQNAVAGVNPVVHFASLPASGGANLYAGSNTATQYFSTLVASANVSVTVANPAPFAGQAANSGALTLDLVNTGILPGTYNTLIVDAKGRATFGALYEFNFITLVGDVIGATSAFNPGGYSGGSYQPPSINTTLVNVLPGPATFVSVTVDSKGRVIAGTTGSSIGNTTISLIGDVSGSGIIANPITLSLANIAAEGTYVQVIVDDTGRVIGGTPPGPATGLINLNGDVSAAGNATALNPVTATLATTGVLAGTYSSVSVDLKGRVLSGSNPPAIVTLSGDVTGTTLSNGITITSLANVVAAGTYTMVTVNSKGLVVAGTGTSYLPLSGGTMSGLITLQGGAQVGYGATYGYYADANNLALRFNTGALYFQANSATPAIMYPNAFVVSVPLTLNGNATVTGTLTANTLTTSTLTTSTLAANAITTTTQAAGNNSTYAATTAFVQTTIRSAIPAGNSVTLLGCSGTAGTASVITLGSGLALYNNNLYFGNVSGAQWQNQGAYFSWNYTGGSGETDLINSKGGGGGGFNFYNVASNANATPALIASINGAGSFTASAGSFSGLLSAGTMSTGTINVGGSINLASGQMIAATAGTVYIQSGSTYIPNMVTISNSAGMIVYVPFAAYSGTFTASIVSASASFTTSVVSSSGSFTALQAASATVSGSLSAGSITTTTQPVGNNSTYVATTAFVQQTVGSYLPLSGGSMSGLITLQGGAQVGYGATYGYYADGSNLAIKLQNTSVLYLLSPTCGIGEISFTGFNVHVPAAFSNTVSLQSNVSVTGALAAGTITTTTQAAGNNSTYVATTAFVQTALNTAIPAGTTANLLACSGTAGSASVMGLSCGLTVYGNNLVFGGVTGTLWANQGAYISWNYTGSGGETDFINSKGGGTGGFNFYNVNSSSTATPSLLASISGTGSFTASAGSFSGLLSAGTMATGTLSIGGSINLASGQMIAATAGTVYIQSGSTYIPNMVTISNSAGMLVYVPFAAVSGTFSSSVVAASGSFTSATVSGSLSAGTITTTTQAAGNNSTYAATTAFVQTALSNAIPAGNSITLLGCSGTAGTASTIALGGGLTLYNNNLYFGNVSGAQWQNQGAYISWNYFGGGGETDFINSRGLGAGGFNFYNVASSSTATPTLLASINNLGLLTTTSGSFSGLLSAGSMTTATQAAGNNSTYVATTAFVQQALGSYQQTVNITGVITGTGTAVGGTITVATALSANATGNNGSILNVLTPTYYTYVPSGGSQIIYTVNVPFGCNFIKATVTGAGGSGACNGTGGAAGGTVQCHFYNINQGDYFTITPGAGGASVNGTYTLNGIAGQATSLILYNSSASVKASVLVSGGAGGYANSTLNGVGVPLGGSLTSMTGNVALGPTEVGGFGTPGVGGHGGASHWGCGGLGQMYVGTYTVGPYNSPNYGAGGGGGCPNYAGLPAYGSTGAGGNGVVYLECYYSTL